jgi:outer membrane protein assembly factor BamB
MALAKAPEPVPLVPVRSVWTLALNNQITLPPAYDQTRVYFSIEHDRLVAYDIASGAQAWLVETHAVFQPSAGDDLVFFAEADALVALHAADGSEAWRAPVPEPLAVRPVWDSGRLVVATKSGMMLGYRATDGQLVWQTDVQSAPHAAPTIAGDRLYVPTTDSRIVALQVTDGTALWERRVGGLPNDILSADDRLFVGSTDDFFYCLMAKDGRIDWRWRTGADVIGVPAADAQRVYFVSLDNVLRALNKVSGGQYWMRALPLRPISGPALAGGTLVVAGQSRTVKTFSVKDGVATADINAGAEVAAPPRALPAVAGFPQLLIVTRDLVKGAAVTLSVRSIEPATVPMAPLPNPIMPAPTPPIRP